MSPANGQTPDDQLLFRYLVGSLPDEEAERLDALIMTDDQVASRLQAIENDLVDAYVKGEVSGEMLDGFRSHYLSSPAKREKVRFAETLLTYQKRSAAAPAHAARGRWWLSSFPQWGLAVAALLILAAAGYLLVENLRLRRQAAESRVARASLEERERQLQTQVKEQRTANDEAAKELGRVRESLAQLEARATASPQPGRTGLLSFVLLPTMRGAGAISTIPIPAGTSAITLRLTLEADDFPRYRVALEDPATDQVIWRAANLQSVSSGNEKLLSITAGGALLKPQIYRLEVTGVPARGPAELVASYSFRVAIK